MRSVRAALLATTLLSTHAWTAWAQSPDAARSAELKKKGDDLLHASNFKEAIAAYDEAYKLDPNPAILYNRSRSLEGLGEWVQALEALEKFSNDASPDLKARVPKLDALMAEQRSHVSSLAITSPVSGAIVSVREKDVGTIPMAGPVRVNSGPAVLEVRAPNYQTFHVRMDLPGGTLTTIDAPLLRVGETAPPPKEKPVPTGRKILSIGIGGVGIAAVGVGFVFLGMREADASTLNKACPMGICPTSRTKELTDTRNRALAEGPIAAALLIGGAVFVGAAIALYPWGGSKSSKPQAAIVVRGSELWLEGEF